MSHERTRCEKWLLGGGAGFEGGEAGSRAVTFGFEGCADVATEFAADVLRGLAEQHRKLPATQAGLSSAAIIYWLRAEADKLEKGE